MVKRRSAQLAAGGRRQKAGFTARCILPTARSFLLPASCSLFLAICFLFTGFSAVQAQKPTGTLSITSTPVGQPVYVNDLLIGLTPLEHYPLPIGQHLIRVSHPDRSDWDTRDWMRTISVTAGATLQIEIPFIGPVTVSSVPFGAMVYVDSSYFGSTPIRLTDLSPGVHTLMIRKEGFDTLTRSLTIQDTSRQMVSFLLTPRTVGRLGSVVRSARSSGRTQKWAAYVTLGLGSLFGGLALYTNHQADLSYQRYLNTADPVLLERSLRSANHYDRRASQYVVVAQVNIAASFYFLIRRAFQRQEPPVDGR